MNGRTGSMLYATADRHVAAPADRPGEAGCDIGGERLRLDYHHEIDDLAALFGEMAVAGARASVFQTHHWLSCWVRHVSGPRDERPLIVEGRGADGRLLCLLPLGVERVAGVSVAGYLGQSHANYGLPLLAPDFAERLKPRDVRALFARIARSHRLAAVRLDHQPADWLGCRNPFLIDGSLLSANDAHVLCLSGGFASLYEAAYSARSRATIRRKSRKLAALGGFTCGRVAGAADGQRFIDVFLAAKSRQLRDGGIRDPFGDPAIAAFYRALADERSGSAVALDVACIQAGGAVGAVALQIEHDNRRYLLNSALCSEALRDGSPGQQLLLMDIEQAAARACATYDFGPGDAAYKAAWHPQRVPLYTTIMTTSAAGIPATALMTASVLVKRSIKRTPALWRFARSLRGQVFGGGRRPPPVGADGPASMA